MATKSRRGFLRNTLAALAAFVPGAAALGKLTALPARASSYPPGYCLCQYTIPIYSYSCEPNFYCQIAWPYVTDMWLEFVDSYDLISYEAFGWRVLCGMPYSEWTSLCCTPWNPQP